MGEVCRIPAVADCSRAEAAPQYAWAQTTGTPNQTRALFKKTKKVLPLTRHKTVRQKTSDEHWRYGATTTLPPKIWFTDKKGSPLPSRSTSFCPMDHGAISCGWDNADFKMYRGRGARWRQISVCDDKRACALCASVPADTARCSKTCSSNSGTWPPPHSWSTETQHTVTR